MRLKIETTLCALEENSQILGDKKKIISAEAIRILQQKQCMKIRQNEEVIRDERLDQRFGK